METQMEAGAGGKLGALGPAADLQELIIEPLISLEQNQWCLNNSQFALLVAHFVCH